MPESSAIDAALVATLRADGALMALLTDGVFFGVADEDSTRYCIVSLVDELDEPMFGGCAYESALYLVKAVIRNPAPADIVAAAVRIQTVLEDQPLSVAGYTWMTTHREARIRYPEPDELDPSNVWEHRGGHYRVDMSVGT